MALKKNFPEMRFGGMRLSADEFDTPVQYVIESPSVSATYLGTCAGGTSTQAKALVITNKALDYPRSLLASVVGTADMGGVFVVNGKDQFGNTIQETFTMGTAAAGTPAGSASGTLIFAEVTSGTFTVATGAVGLGSARLGVGTVAANNRWGLPVKIASVDDVKSITWVNNVTPTAINGGTVQDATYVGTAQHYFVGTSGVANTDKYIVRIRSTYISEENVNQ